jgi:hypothetical protein
MVCKIEKRAHDCVGWRVAYRLEVKASCGYDTPIVQELGVVESLAT